MKGRLIIRTPEQAERLNIAWRQFGADSEILFTGPLGASIARISSQDQLFLLEQPGEQPRTARSLEALVMFSTGIEIPISAVLPVLAGEVKAVRAGKWRLEVTALDERERPIKVSIYGPGTTIQLTVTEWQ